MDVLALRKSSGEIEGEVKLNGHLQEDISFRRCTGYVEQFDVQSAELTIRETVQFSAKLRLEETDPAVTDESINSFVDQTLNMLELTNLQDLQVGSDETGGLSFEQKKRLSIAVELVANPSILFLDEVSSCPRVPLSVTSAASHRASETLCSRRVVWMHVLLRLS